jgi:hypothetical protein
MPTVASLILMAPWIEEPVTTNFPLLQLVLGFVGLCSMISYAITRQEIRDRSQSEQQQRSTACLLRHVREWLGKHYGAAGHAGQKPSSPGSKSRKLSAILDTFTVLIVWVSLLVMLLAVSTAFRRGFE